MRVSVGRAILELVQGDIAREEVDAIVNAANADLAGGGGVDGAIHRAGGPEIMEETARRFPDGCPTGSAVATAAGQLPARSLFHAVGPIWKGGQHGEADLLRSAYQTCLDLAVEHQCASIAFPAISTGVYGYPRDLAAQVALTTAWDHLTRHAQPERVRFVLFDAGAFGAFARVLEGLRDRTL